MKKIVLLSLTLLVTLLFLTACGVPQKDYDKLASDLAAAQTQIQTLQSEKQASQNIANKAGGELAAAQAQVQTLQSENQALIRKMEQGRAMVEILNTIMLPFLRGDAYSMTDAESLKLFLDWRDKIKALGDPTLERKLETLISSVMAGQNSDQASIDFFLYLLESIPAALTSK